MAWRARSFIRIFILIDPAFHANNSINCLSFGKSIVNRDTESLKRDLSFAIPLGTGDIGSTEPSGTADTNSVSPKIHSSLDGPLHSATESDPPFELNDNLLTHALRIELRFTDLYDIDLNLGTSGNFGDFVGHNLNLRSLPSNDKSRAGGMKSNTHTIPSAFDNHLSKSGSLKASCKVSTDRKIFVKLVGVVFALSVPL